MQKILESCGSEKSALAQEMSLLSSFEMHLCFYAVMFLEDYIQKNLVSTSCNCNSGM